MRTLPGLFDELAHAGDEHLDSAYVATYDSKAQTDPTDDLRLLRGLGLDRTSTLVDFGAGTGTLALAAAAVCRRVVAVDISSPMLDRLHGCARRLGLTNVECVRSGFHTYEHQGELADFVYSRNALHHLPDFWKGIAMHRVPTTLRSGGIFCLRDLVFSFAPRDAEVRIAAWLAQAPVRPEDGWTAPELATHLREEYSTYSWLLEPMLARAGFNLRDIEYSVSQVFAAYTCVKR